MFKLLNNAQSYWSSTNLVRLFPFCLIAKFVKPCPQHQRHLPSLRHLLFLLQSEKFRRQRCQVRAASSTLLQHLLRRAAGVAAPAKASPPPWTRQVTSLGSMPPPEPRGPPFAKSAGVATLARAPPEPTGFPPAAKVAKSVSFADRKVPPPHPPSDCEFLDNFKGEEQSIISGADPPATNLLKEPANTNCQAEWKRASIL